MVRTFEPAELATCKLQLRHDHVPGIFSRAYGSSATAVTSLSPTLLPLKRYVVSSDDKSIMQRCTVRDIMSFNVIAAYYLPHSLASLSKQMNKLCGQYTPASQRVQWWFDVV